MPPALKVQSLSHWTIREVPGPAFLRKPSKMDWVTNVCWHLTKSFSGYQYHTSLVSFPLPSTKLGFGFWLKYFTGCIISPTSNLLCIFTEKTLFLITTISLSPLTKLAVIPQYLTQSVFRFP